MVIDNTTLLTVSDMSAVDALIKLLNEDIFKSSALVSVSKTSNPNEIELSYKVNNTDGSSDYNIAGLFFNRRTGYMYCYPSRVDTAIVLVDACALFNATVKRQFNKVIDIPVTALDNFYQNVKLEGIINRNVNLVDDQFSDCVNRYDYSGQKTNIGKLLYGSANSQQFVKVDWDSFAKFYNYHNSMLLKLSKAFVNMMSSVTDKPSGILGTYKLVSDAISPVMNGPTMDKILNLMDNHSDAPLLSELSTNPIFSPTTRDYLGKLIDPSSKDGFTRDKTFEKQYDALLRVVNASDFIQNQQVASVLQTAVNQHTNNNIGDTSDYDVYGTKLVRVRQLDSAVSSIVANMVPIEDINKSLDKIEADDEPLVDPSVYVMPTKLINAMIKLLNC